MGQVYMCIDLNNAEKIVMPENSSKPSISYNSSQNNSALLVILNVVEFLLDSVHHIILVKQK